MSDDVGPTCCIRLNRPLDGTAIVNLLRPIGCKNCEAYAHDVFIKYIKSRLANVSRLDIVWDRYLEENSLKATTRSKHGTGITRHVLPGTIYPRTGPDFFVTTVTSRNCLHILLK